MLHIHTTHGLIRHCIPHLSRSLAELPQGRSWVLLLYHRSILLQPEHVGREGLFGSIGILLSFLLPPSLLDEYIAKPYLSIYVRNILVHSGRVTCFVRFAGLDALLESFFLFLDFSFTLSSSESSSSPLPLLLASESYLIPQPLRTTQYIHAHVSVQAHVQCTI